MNLLMCFGAFYGRTVCVVDDGYSVLSSHVFWCQRVRPRILTRVVNSNQGDSSITGRGIVLPPLALVPSGMMMSCFFLLTWCISLSLLLSSHKIMVWISSSHHQQRLVCSISWYCNWYYYL